MPTLEGFDSFHIAQDVVIAAPRDAVWRALTRDITKWWAFRLTDEDAELTLDTRIGGLFVEQAASGKGAVWGQIVDLRPEESMRLSGALGMRSRPVNSIYSFTLCDHADGTRVELDHRCFGELDPEWATNHDEGWKRLLHTCLKGYLEKGLTREDLAAEESSG